jgi:hypothetical protein
MLTGLTELTREYKVKENTNRELGQNFTVFSDPQVKCYLSASVG